MGQVYLVPISIVYGAPANTIRAPFAGCPDFYSRDKNLIAFLQNLKLNTPIGIMGIPRDLRGFRRRSS